MNYLGEVYKMRRFPEIIEFQTHNLCNAGCIICPYEKTKEFRLKGNNDFAFINKIVEEVKLSDGQVRRLIPYLNNEPLLDRDIFEKIEYIKKQIPEIEVELSTNLSKFSDVGFTRLLRNNHVDDLRISVFGGNETTYRMMMPRLNFSNVRKNILKLKEIHENTGSKTKVCLVCVAYEHLDVVKTIEELKAIVDGYFDVRVFGYLDRAGNCTDKNDKIFNPDEYELDGCSLLRNSERMCITANGNTILCSQDWMETGGYGNIKDSSIEELWVSSKKALLDKQVQGIACSSSDFICKDCKLANVKNCSSTVLNFNGDKYISKDDHKKSNILSALEE